MKMSQRLQFVCTVTAEAHVTDSRIIFGNWVEDGETDTLFELLHASLCYWKSYKKTFLCSKKNVWSTEKFHLSYKEKVSL